MRSQILSSSNFPLKNELTGNSLHPLNISVCYYNKAKIIIYTHLIWWVTRVKTKPIRVNNKAFFPWNVSKTGLLSDFILREMVLPSNHSCNLIFHVTHWWHIQQEENQSRDSWNLFQFKSRSCYMHATSHK